MWPFKRTPKPSETAELLKTVTKLAAEVALNSEANRKMSEKLLELAASKDAQIKLVLESKFQQYVVMAPARDTPAQEPESFEHLADVSEMSEQTAEDEVEKATARQRKADEELEQALRGEYEELAAEHEASHGKEPQA
jgi:hypothetical protein